MMFLVMPYEKISLQAFIIMGGQVVVELATVKGYFGWSYWAGRQSDLKAAFELGDLVVD
jgi:hypothetical protein